MVFDVHFVPSNRMKFTNVSRTLQVHLENDIMLFEMMEISIYVQ